MPNSRASVLRRGLIRTWHVGWARRMLTRRLLILRRILHGGVATACSVALVTDCDWRRLDCEPAHRDQQTNNNSCAVVSISLAQRVCMYVSCVSQLAFGNGSQGRKLKSGTSNSSWHLRPMIQQVRKESLQGRGIASAKRLGEGSLDCRWGRYPLRAYLVLYHYGQQRSREWSTLVCGGDLRGSLRGDFVSFVQRP